MHVKRRKFHKYLGMILDYSTVDQLKITILDYIDELMDAFDEAGPMSGFTKSSTAPSNLLKVDEDCKNLNTKRAVEFHHLVAKILFSTKRVRPDTCTAISFLTTRVREPDSDNWAKLVYIMKDIRGTRNPPLILSDNGRCILKWGIDESFEVHLNMRGQTGGGLSMGRGFPMVSSTKQNLNT